MKTLSNVILYAKNWYRHSSNVIEDLKKIIPLDDPNADVSSKQKIWEWLVKGSLDIMKEYPNLNCWSTNEKVAWEDDEIVASIWSLLICMQCYIPMNIHYMDAPKYDFSKGIYPQYEVRNSIFKKNMTEKECIEVAEKYLATSNLYQLDILANDMLDKLNFEEISERFSHLGDAVTADELDEEFWNAYSDVVNKHIVNEEVEQFSETMNTKHFSISVSNLNTNVSIEVHNVLYRTKVDNENFVDSFIENTNFDRIREIVSILNETENADIPEKSFTDDEIRNTIAEHYESVLNNHTDIQFGYFHTVASDSEIEVVFQDFFTCVCYENELYNIHGLFVDGEKK